MKRLAAILAILCAPAFAEPIHGQIDVQDTCINWGTFPVGTWQNTTGQTLAIAHVRMSFSGADHIVGELALWVDRIGRPTDSNPAHPNRMFSFSDEVYALPSQPIAMDLNPEPDARFTLLAGESVQLMINCGPIKNGQVAFSQFVYFGELVLTMVPQ
jgi:hypothetical protein